MDERRWGRIIACICLVFLVGLPSVGCSSQEERVEKLIGDLKDEDDFVRGKAARILGKVGYARAVDPLTAALKDGSRFVRRKAAWSLGMIGVSRQ